MKKIILLVVILIVAYFSLRGLFGYHSEEEYQEAIAVPMELDSGTRLPFNVDEGMTARAINQKLVDNELIPNDWAFLWYLDRHDLTSALQAGQYVLKEGMTIPDIADTFLTGRAAEALVVIPEGFRLSQIDARLAAAGLIEPGELMDNRFYHSDYGIFADFPSGVDIEGYLYPDTYYFEVGNTTAKGIIDRLSYQMGTLFNSTLRARAEELGLSLHEVITLASLLERETFSSDEMPIIAGIMLNRLDLGMRLDIDATVQYAISDDGWKQSLTADDLATDSPYNTRKFGGLPPGPICSPSLDAIKAVLYSEDTDYLYYLHDSDGVAHFARTNAEHNANRAKYL